MALRVIILLLFACTFMESKAQRYESAFHLGWNTLKPLSDKEFTSKTSSAGARIGFTKFVNDYFGFGAEGSYNTLNDYVPLTTYVYEGGAVTTDVYNYMYYFTLMANAQYYFMQGRRFIPYTSLAMGIAFTEYRMFYNVFEDSDSKQSFVIRPEVGTLFRMKEYSNVGFKASLSYDYATNKSEYFVVGNFSGISLLVGVVLFTE